MLRKIVLCMVLLLAPMAAKAVNIQEFLQPHFTSHRVFYQPRLMALRSYRHRYAFVTASEIVSHPYGCPHREFCGCGVADKVFGYPARTLWSVASWLQFPRAEAAPGNAAIFWRHRRPAHIVYIMRPYGDGTAMVYDPNSGHHLTRIHRIDIRWATIVNPRYGRHT